MREKFNTMKKQQIREARPKLHMFSPLSFWLVVIFAIFNLTIGSMFIIDSDRFATIPPYLTINPYITYDIWGIIFFAIGVIQAWSLYRNNWSMIRKSMLIGVLTKSVWVIAIFIQSQFIPATLFPAYAWTALTAIQIATFIFFLPVSPSADSHHAPDLSEVER